MIEHSPDRNIDIAGKTDGELVFRSLPEYRP